MHKCTNANFLASKKAKKNKSLDIIALKIMLFFYFIFDGQKGMCKHITYKNTQSSCFYSITFYLYLTLLQFYFYIQRMTD